MNETGVGYKSDIPYALCDNMFIHVEFIVKTQQMTASTSRSCHALARLNLYLNEVSFVQQMTGSISRSCHARQPISGKAVATSKRLSNMATSLRHDK